MTKLPPRGVLKAQFQRGQSLIEVIVAATVGILVVTALTFATIFSLRNAGFAKNSAQAIKLAQEGIERVRTGRDRGDPISGFFIGSYIIDSWQDPNLWNYSISSSCGSNNCYFKFNGSNFQYFGTGNDIPSNAEDPLGDGKFKRAVILSDDSSPVALPDGTITSSYKVQKTATVLVRWTDATGSHDSNLSTILRKL